MSSALLYQNLMIYLLVLMMYLICTDKPLLYCSSSLVLYIVYIGYFYLRALKKGIKFGLGSEKKGTIVPPDLLEEGYILKAL